MRLTTLCIERGGRLLRVSDCELQFSLFMHEENFCANLGGQVRPKSRAWTVYLFVCTYELNPYIK